MADYSDNMDKMKPRYNLENPNDIQELINLLENGDLSDVDMPGYESDDDLLDEDPTINPVRPGADHLTKADEEKLAAIAINAQDNNNENENLETDENDDAENVSLKKKVKWRHNAVFTSPDFRWVESHSDDTNEMLTPLEYFRRYIPSEEFQKMAEFTNIYAHQQGKPFKNTTPEEIEILFALHIMIGCLNKFPRLRLYWENVLKINIFVDNMSRDRFYRLRTCLHMVNNLERPQGCSDKFFKVRPIMNSVRRRLLELDMDKDLCIDEQMIPFSGKLSIKQYIKGKPTPWGIKIFVLCGRNGQAYDFVAYQGQSTEIDESIKKKFGLGSGVVLHLCERIQQEGHKLFFDNYFSSYLLFESLKEKRIFAAGTIRINRFYKPPVMSDKDIKKKKRGFSDQVVSSDGIIITKWLDNKPVCLASNYVGKGEEDTVRRWDKKISEYIEITRPEVVKSYNHSMGGVDLLDQLISIYRIFIRSRKWTLRVIMHFVDFALVNAWLEYKKDCRIAAIPTNKVNDLLTFRTRVAEGLIMVKKIVKPNKKGRPSTGSPIPTTPTPSYSHTRGEKRPFKEIQYDATDHMPQFDDNKEATRCKNSKCTQRSHVFCDKCKVHLCLLKHRNCFLQFHRKS